MARQIKLTRGKVALVDDEDFERVNQFKWYVHRVSQNKIGYASRSDTVNGKERTLQMHNLVMGSPLGFDNGMVIDHISGDTLDNRKSNLRMCTRLGNARNAKRRKDNTSGYKGVYKYRDGMWYAAICIDGKQQMFGYYRTPEEAAVVYNNAAKDHFGEFARLNDVKHIKPVRIAPSGRFTKPRSASGYFGVSFDKARNKWHSSIFINGKTVHIGRFDSAKEAAIAFDAVSIKNFGDVGNVNFR